MYFRYGSYTHALGEAKVVIDKTSRFNNKGEASGITSTWTIMGMLQADTPSALTTAINEMVAAYDRQGQTAVLLLPDGTESAHRLDSNSSVGPVRVTKVSFPNSDGGEYSTFRSYQIEIQADFQVEGQTAGSGGGGGTGPITLLTYEETVTAIGGGQRWIYMPTLTGSPQRQTVQAQSPYRFTQQGRAVGVGGYPNWPGPMFPGDEHQDQRSISLKSPVSDNSTSLLNYEVTWSYSFESSSALSGYPSV